MPQRSTKRKLKRNCPEIENEEPEQSSSRVEAESVLGNHDFEEVTKKVENSVLRRKKDTETNQKELFNLLMKMSKKRESLVVNHPGDQTGVENIDPTFPLEIILCLIYICLLRFIRCPLQT